MRFLNGQFRRQNENDRSWADVKNTLKKLKNQLTLEVHISEFGDGMMTKTIKRETSNHDLFIDIIISKKFSQTDTLSVRV